MKKRINYLDKIPVHSPKLICKTDGNDSVTLLIENKGLVNLLAQKIFKKPQTSYIHLDETGSFVWLNIDGKKSIYDIAASVDEHFGEKSHPLYERIADFFMILERNNFIFWIE